MSITITVGLLLSTMGGLEIVPVDVDRDAAREAIVRAPVAVEEALPAIAEAPLRGSDQGPNGSSSFGSSSFDGITLEPTPEAEHSATDESSGPRRFQILDRELRPEWVGQPPQVKGEGVHWIAVSSDPWKSQFEAEEALTRRVRKAVAEYIDEQIGRANASRGVRLNQADLHRLLSPAQKYREELLFADSAIGVMQQHHAQVVFSPEFRADIRQRWREHVVTARLLRTGGTVVAVFVGLLVAFAALKSATR